MDIDDYDEYEEDNEDIENSSNENEDSDIDYEFYENAVDDEEDKNDENKKNDTDEEIIEENEILDDDSDSDTMETNIKSKSNIIMKYKQENIELFSPLGMISYLCNIVDYIKKGGKMLDNRQTFNYPDETEESYALECILLDKIPYEYIINKKKINLDKNAILLCLKIILRCVDDNNSIFFTPVFTKKFPIFIKSLFNNYISIEEIQEIENLKIS